MQKSVRDAKRGSLILFESKVRDSERIHHYDEGIVYMDMKKKLRRSVPYQIISFKTHMPLSKERYMSLPEDEKSKERVCLYTGNKVKQLLQMIKMIRVQIRPGKRYQMWIDTGLTISVFNTMTDNIPPDYSLIVDHSISELKEKNADRANKVMESNYKILIGIENYIQRIIREIDKFDNIELIETKKYYCRMLTGSAESLEEALQRILFWSSLFWQSRHRLVGLGRLDKILDRFAYPENRIEIITDFLLELHRYYPYKSNRVTLGDTGQIIVLGGKNSDGTYFHNPLTYQFINALMQVHLPDPKILLRVSSEMPSDLLKLAIECISTGIGCPLLSNDEVVIPAIEEFNYTHEDACDYVTSACWEPLVFGKSMEKNNICDLNFANAIVKMYKSNNFSKCSTFNDIILLYKKCLSDELEEVIKRLDSIRWESDPLMSMFTQGCIESGKDISDGGAIYKNYGILSVGISNTINSLLNIKKLVFEKRLYSLDELRAVSISDYKDAENIKEDLQKEKYFGKDDEEVVFLTKEISEYVYQYLQDYKNCFGGKLKWGFSSSNYLELGKNTAPTLDGRCYGEPLGVHISCQDSISYTELISFAAKMNYNGNRSNGNVVDFFVSPLMINNNIDKFQQFLEVSIKLGFFQMQMNVVDSKTLIDAKNHPEKHLGLIVRVWGFSAFFNDLPDSYKDLLISRALQSEGVA